jgi:hypothetical protein
METGIFLQVVDPYLTKHSYGLSNDIPVPKDYNGDCKTDVAMFRPSFGTWHILSSGSNSCPKPIVVQQVPAQTHLILQLSKIPFPTKMMLRLLNLPTLALNSLVQIILLHLQVPVLLRVTLLFI